MTKKYMQNHLSKKCIYCNLEYSGPYWLTKDRKYCSLNCANKDRGGDKNPSKRLEVRKKISESKQREWANKRSKYRTMNRDWSPESRIRMRDLKSLEYPTRNNFRRFILKNFDNLCYLCQKEEALIVHHIDGNREHNDIENFVILCTSCHNLLHKLEKNIDKVDWIKFNNLLTRLLKREVRLYGK